MGPHCFGLHFALKVTDKKAICNGFFMCCLNVGKYTGNRLGVSGNTVLTVNGSCHTLPGAKGQHAQLASTNKNIQTQICQKQIQIHENCGVGGDGGGLGVGNMFSVKQKQDTFQC